MGADNWSRGKIRYHLESKGYATFTEIEAEYGLPPATISSAIRFPLEKGEDVIASILGLHPAEIWPRRYGARGVRLKPQPVTSYTAPRVVGKYQKSVAA